MTTASTNSTISLLTATASHLKPDSGPLSTPSKSHIDAAYNDSRCLFCNHVDMDVNQNLKHMSKAHGLHIDLTDLLVDIDSLLSYMHLLIFECHECIFCGTQRNTCQAVQQHMMAKGHCKYDPTDENSELYDFFGQSSSVSQGQIQRAISDRSLGQRQISSKLKSRKARLTRRTSNAALAEKLADTDSSPSSDSDSMSDTQTSSVANAMSTRMLRQEHTLQSQLSQLRASDQQSLAHLPTSQQRAMLATRHKQMEQARRVEQTYHSHLESAGNKFGRLSTIRLIRKPPHTGNIHSLNK